jgi:hypothetical protein
MSNMPTRHEAQETPSAPSQKISTEERDEKRRARIRFKIRVARAVGMIARSGCTTRQACRCVGLKVGTKSERAVKAACDSLRIPRWRASPTCRAVLQLSLPHEAKARPRPMRAMQTHEPSPAFVDSPARRRLKLRYVTTNTEARG